MPKLGFHVLYDMLSSVSLFFLSPFAGQCYRRRRCPAHESRHCRQLTEQRAHAVRSQGFEAYKGLTEAGIRSGRRPASRSAWRLRPLQGLSLHLRACSSVMLIMLMLRMHCYAWAWLAAVQQGIMHASSIWFRYAFAWLAAVQQASSSWCQAPPRASALPTFSDHQLWIEHASRLDGYLLIIRSFIYFCKKSGAVGIRTQAT